MGRAEPEVSEFGAGGGQKAEGEKTRGSVCEFLFLETRVRARHEQATSMHYSNTREGRATVAR